MGKSLIIGGILGNYVVKGPNIIKLLFERCRYLLMTKPKKMKAKKDFGHFILSLPEKPIPRPDFVTLLKKKKMKLDKDLVEGVANAFALKKKIDCRGLTKAYMDLYPDTCLPPVVPKKAKKGKKGKKGKVVDIEQELGVVDLDQAPEEIGGRISSALNKESRSILNKSSRPALDKESQPGLDGEMKKSKSVRIMNDETNDNL